MTVALAIVTILTGVIITVTAPIGHTGDSSCGSLASPNFRYDMWNTSTQCGLVHVGLLGYSTAGCVLLVVLVDAERRRQRCASRRRSAWPVIPGACVSAIFAALIYLATSVQTDPVIRRGWTSLRTVSLAWLSVLALLSGLVIWNGRSHPRDRD